MVDHQTFHFHQGVFSCGARRIAGRGRGAVETVDEAKLQGLFSWDMPATCDHLEPCFEPGKYASWIAPPKVGIDNKPGDFEYVKLHMA